MANEVKITVTAEDKASAQVDQIGKSITGLKTVIAGTAAGFAAFRVAEQVFDTIKQSITSAIKAAEDLNVVQAQTEAVLRSTGGAAGITAREIGDLAASLEQMSGIDEVAIQGAENLLLTFTNIGQDVFPQASQAVLDMSVALGQDLKSSAIQLGKALQDPVEGVTALRRVGVNFNETQRDMIESMVKAGDTAGAQAYILRELQTEFGGSAKAAEDARGGINRARDAFDDAQRDIAQLFIPVIHEAQKSAIGLAADLFQYLKPALTTIAATAIGMSGDWSRAWGMLPDSMRTDETVNNMLLIINTMNTLIDTLKFVVNAAIGAANALVAVGKALLISGLAMSGNFDEMKNQIESLQKGEGFIKTFAYSGFKTAAEIKSQMGAGSLTRGIDMGAVIDDVNNYYATTKAAQEGLSNSAKKTKETVDEMAQEMQRIQDKFLADQVEAYIAGGDKAVTEVKASQQKILAEALTVAQHIADTYGVKVSDVVGLALDELTQRSDKLAQAAKAASQAAFDLTTQLWRQAGGSNMSAQSAQGLAAIAQAATMGLSGYTTAEGKFIATGGTGDITKALEMGLLRDTFGMGGGGTIGGTTTVVNVNAGVIGDPAAAGKAVADAINKAANTNGPLISAGAVQ